MKNSILMTRGFLSSAVGLALATAFLLFSSAAFAADSSDYRTVDGIAIY